MYCILLCISAIKYLFLQALLACIINSVLLTTHNAAMPPMSPEEQAAFEEFMQSLNTPEGQKLLKDIEDEYNKLSPAEKDALNKQAEDDLKRMGIDPTTYQPIEPTQPTAPTTPDKVRPQAPTEPTPDCSQEKAQSCHQASTLLTNTISYLEIVRQKLGAINLETSTIQEWLGAITYYLKIMNQPEHIERFTSVDFTNLFDLITQLEKLVRTEANALIIVSDEEETRSDDPYAILGVAYDATDEEIKKAYEDELAENDPELLKKELLASKTDATKISKRMRRATLRQATITDAYEQLSNPQLRQQLDRSRGNTQQQQLALRDANIASTERLYDELNNLIEQGLIKDLEAFLTRYAPTELAYYQQMELAEKDRINEQRAAAGLKPISSPLGGFGGGGFSYGGYQPPAYYPGNDYSSQGYHPSFSPQGGGGSGGGSSGGSGADAQPGGEKSKGGEKGDKKKDDKKKDDGKKDDKKKKDGDEKKEKKKDDVDSIVKDFKKALDDLKGPISKFKDYIEAEEQEDVRKRITSIIESRAKGSKKTEDITGDSFKKLHTGLKKHVGLPLVNKLQAVAKLVTEKVAPNKKALDECRGLWEAHQQSQLGAYATLGVLCQQASEALQKNPKLAEEIPWNNLKMACDFVGLLQKTFKKPDTKKSASEKDKKGTKAQNATKTTETSEEDETSEKEQKEKSKKIVLTDEQVKNIIDEVEKAYANAKAKIDQGDNKQQLTTAMANVKEALKDKKLQKIIDAKTTFNKLLTDMGIDQIFKKLPLIKLALQTPLEILSDANKKALQQLMKMTLEFNKSHSDIVAIEVLSKKVHRFLYPGPYAPEEAAKKLDEKPVEIEAPKEPEKSANVKAPKEATEKPIKEHINIETSEETQKREEEVKKVIDAALALSL